MAMLEIKNIHKSFRTYDEKSHFHIGPFPRGHARRVVRTLDVLRGVDLTVEKGDVVAILGPSGSGKTTLLRCLNFLEPTDSGSLTFDGETFDLSRISGADIARLRKKTAFVFQNYNLFRNKTALQNVTEGLVVARKMPKAEADAIGRKMLAKVGLANRADAYPRQLSGGQQQRVALARILCSQPEAILLDEPFSALDSFLKWNLELELSDRLADFQGPILWVSHDRGEVFRNCKRVCVLDQGASQGTFTLRQLFHEPETEAAARLSGCKNIVEAVPAGSAVTLPAWGLTLSCGKPVPADICQAGIRARHVMTVPEGTPDAFYCTVERVIQDVFTTIVLLRPEGAASGAPLLRMELERDDWRRLNRPEGLWIAIQPRDILLLK